MRITLALLVVMMMVAPATADGTSRAQAVVDALGVDDATAKKLVDLVGAYDRELTKLTKQRAESMRRLLAAPNLDRKSVDRLLDSALEIQHAVVDADLRLMGRARQLLPAPKAMQLLLLISVSEPAPREPTKTAYDPDALLPSKPCDPFASMHGCR